MKNMGRARVGDTQADENYGAREGDRRMKNMERGRETRGWMKNMGRARDGDTGADEKYGAREGGRHAGG